MRIVTSSALLLAASLVSTSTGVVAQDNNSSSICGDYPIPINAADFSEPDWESIIELAFPPWPVPEAGCPRLDAVGGTVEPGFEEFSRPEEDKFNPCYYTKAFAGLDPSKGGYPTPIDTHYPYEFAAPFFKQPGDGSTHHCSNGDPTVNIAECPKLGNDCGPDCASITDDYGIGHIPPFVPLAAIKNAYKSCEQDVCSWFHYETSGCNIQKSVMDKLVYQYFGDGDKIKYQPPILIDGAPSSTYYRLEYVGESPACDQGNCRGPHYCSKEVADAGNIWGDFCPYVHTGENAGKYRHPHIALAALELWIANKCMPDKCPNQWLESPNGANYGFDAKKTSTSITWCEMDNNIHNNTGHLAQPKVPYVWPTSGAGIFPGHEDLYEVGQAVKSAPGVYVNEFVELMATTSGAGFGGPVTDGSDSSVSAGSSVKLTWSLAAFGVAFLVLAVV